MLYHLLPVAFWLLAIGGIVFWEFSDLPSSVFDYLPTLLALVSGLIIRRIQRHAPSVEPCLQVGILIGIAACRMPSVVFLILPIWGYLIYRNLFGLRPFYATLIGLAIVAVWAAVLHQLSIVNCQLSIADNLSAWVPTGAVLIAWLASTISRQILRVR